MNDNAELQKPDWEYWRQRGAATLPQAVLLSLDIEPRNFAGYGGMEELDRYQRESLVAALDKHKPGMGQQFTDRLAMTEKDKGAGKWR